MKFELSKEYKYILVPLYMIVITIIGQPPYWNWQYYMLPPIALWSWYLFLTSPYKLEITTENTISTQCILQKATINPQNTIWMKETMLFLVIKHSQGKIRISTLFNNINGIKSAIKSLNPEIETKYKEYRGGTYK